MDYLQLLAFMFVVLLLVISPGPNGFLIAKTVPTHGKKAGFSNVLGFLAAFYVHGALSIFGISVLLTKSADAFFVVKLLGAMYLTWIGVKSLIGAFKAPDEQKVKQKATQVAGRNRTLKKSFFEGFLTNVLNPKVSMFYLAAFPQFIPVSEHALLYAFLLVSIHCIINICWFSSMILLLSRLAEKTKNGAFHRILKGLTGFVFIGFGAKLLVLENN